MSGNVDNINIHLFVLPVWHWRDSPLLFFLILCLRARLVLMLSVICRYGVVAPFLLSRLLPVRKTILYYMYCTAEIISRKIL